MSFFENLFGFLFFPTNTSKANLGQIMTSKNQRSAHFYVLYLSIILGVIFWFFVGYPEPLYYGIPGEIFQKDMPSMLVSDPLLFLILIILVSIFNQYFINYLFIGYLSYKINLKFTRQDNENRFNLKNYLTFYAYSFSPLLFCFPLIIYWIFFFERLLFMTPLFTFFDLTAPNIILVSLLTFFLFWKYMIEVKLNKQFFKNSTSKAIIPVILQILLLLGLVLIVFIVSNILIDSILRGLVI